MSDVLARMKTNLEKNGITISKRSKTAKIFGSGGVPRTAEFDRIASLPVMDWESVAREYHQQLQDYLRLPNGSMQLHPWQVAALVYAFELRGVFVQAGVGAGKTLVSLLAPVVCEAQRPVLMLPAGTAR